MGKSHIKGLKQWEKWIEDIPEDIEQEVEDHVKTTAYKIEADAKRNAPVETGTLRREITTEITREGKHTEAEVGTNLEYASFVEFGTSKMAAQPFLIPAFIKHKDDFEAELKRIVKDGLR